MIDKIHTIFNNREIAVGIVTFISLIFIGRSKETRKAFVELIKAFLKLYKPFILMIIYILGIVYLLNRIGIWDLSMLKETIYWFFGGAFILFVNLNDISNQDNYFKKLILDNFKLILIIEFISNFATFNLIAEVISVFLVIILSMIEAFTDKDKSKEKEHKLTVILLSIYGISTLINSIIILSKDTTEFLNSLTFESLLLTPLLSILIIPFLYVLGVFATYQIKLVTFRHIHRNNKKLYRYGTRRILWSCNFSLKKIKLISKELKPALLQDKKQVKKAIKDILKTGKQIIPYMEEIEKLERKEKLKASL